MAMSSRSASTSEPASSPSGAPPTSRRGARLVVVATPIGNLGDLSPRAVEALATAGFIYCEDTRRTMKLLSHASIKGPRLVSHHRFNEAASTAMAIERLEGGAIIALVTDAGTPLVSDPGGRLVRAAVAAGIPVEAVPGPSAALTALVVSGLSTDRWCFDRAVVVFESPYRVQRLLDDLAATCGPDRPVAVCRELTKLHEEVWRGSVAQAAERARTVKPRGEYVLVVGPVSAAVATSAGRAPM
jgi:16S rRNA (cytidine1402-2'-O)-methyltransferase